MLDLFDKINEARAAIQAKWNRVPKVAIVLGTGLGGLVNDIEIEATIEYGDIPNFRVLRPPAIAADWFGPC